MYSSLMYGYDASLIILLSKYYLLKAGFEVFQRLAYLIIFVQNHNIKSHTMILCQNGTKHVWTPSD